MPAAWDRLADATQAPGAKPALSVVTLGHVHAEDLLALTPHVERLEQLVLDVSPRDSLSMHRAEFNRAVDAAGCDWILIVRERENVGEELAREITAAVTGGKARGFRIRSIPIYAGKPLHLNRDDGEVRLFHRRYYMRFANRGEWQELTIQGTVMRMHCAFQSVTFATTEEHRAFLESKAAPHSWLRRALLFLRYWIGARTFDPNTMRYLWVEAGFDIAPSR